MPVSKAQPVSATGLQALCLIETVGDAEPFTIRPVRQCQGGLATTGDSAADKIRWAERAGYTILTRDVPRQFAPYNAILRISAGGTEDRQRDYLAVFSRD